MGQHSLIPPSSAHIWGKPNGCTGWVLMAQAYPQQEGDAAKEGTAAHKVAEALVDGAAPDYMLNQSIDGIMITNEILEAAELYAADILYHTERASVHTSSGTETKLMMPAIHEEEFGTVDHWLYDPKQEKLIIWDFKYGYGIVEASDNWQAICYASGLMDLHNIDGHEQQSLTIDIRIVQPRAFHDEGPIRSWKVKGSDLRAEINILAANATEALGPNAKTRAGTHCRYCTARHSCPALQAANMAALDYLAAPMPKELDPEGRSLELRILQQAQDLIKYRITGLEEIIKSKAAEGEPTPGFSVEASLGRETWINDPATVISMGNAFGVDLSKPGVITPNQAIKAGMDKDTIKHIVKREKKGTKLVPDNKSTLASRVFKKQEA